MMLASITPCFDIAGDMLITAVIVGTIALVLYGLFKCVDLLFK